MNTEQMVVELNREIERLTQARDLLISEPLAPKRGPGRPAKLASKGAPAKAKRVMSPEGREKIAAAQRKRHAAKKRAAKKAAAAS